MPLPWPESYQLIKEKVYDQWKVRKEIEILREFGEGKSTARVFCIYIESGKYNGLAILNHIHAESVKIPSSGLKS